jgi:hypothetical protein
MKSWRLGIAALALASVALAPLAMDALGQARQPAAKAPKRAATPTVSFREDVFPIFKGRCLGCHEPGGEGFEKSGLDLRTYEGLMKGTKFGPMVIPGDPNFSSLMVLLDWRASPQLRMPHGSKKLSSCDRDAIRTWIREGAQNN